MRFRPARSPRSNIFSSPAAHTSIPAKAGISFSRQREFSAKRNIAIVACRRMRLRRRDSGFRRNGRGLLARYIFSPSEKIYPYPVKYILTPPRKRRGVKKQATGSKKNRRGKKTCARMIKKIYAIYFFTFAQKNISPPPKTERRRRCIIAELLIALP